MTDVFTVHGERGSSIVAIQLPLIRPARRLVIRDCIARRRGHSQLLLDKATVAGLRVR
ncbi:MAG TPA: hypothetical protein VF147_16970 [Vicinamibacterales bacterium]